MDTLDTPAPTILFTAFEPSGDDHAAGVIAALRRRAPHVRIVALGGPKMHAAGAELLQTTTEHAVMLAGAVGQAMAHRKRVASLRGWLRENPVVAHVPVDSPAANWAICQAVRDLAPQAKILHLVAPQLWAWAPWRIRKLARLTDHVMCLLPFEPDWFASRGVPATFVGHPLFDKPRVVGQHMMLGLPDRATPKLALLPGSRASEIRRNWPTMMQVATQLRQTHPGLAVVAALRDEAALKLIPGGVAKAQAKLPHLAIRAGQTEAVLDWADAVLVVSGTATLLVAACRRPMVTLFNTSRWQWELLGRWLIKTRTFALPNLIGEAMGLGRVAPEFVPHFGQVKPIVQAIEPLLTDTPARRSQVARIEQVIAPFQDHVCGSEAATILLNHLPDLSAHTPA